MQTKEERRARRVECTRLWRDRNRSHIKEYNHRYKQGLGQGLPDPCIICGSMTTGGRSNTCSEKCRLIRREQRAKQHRKKQWAVIRKRESADPLFRQLRLFRQKQWHKFKRETDPQFVLNKKIRARKNRERILANPELHECQLKLQRERRRKLMSDPVWQKKQNDPVLREKEYTRRKNAEIKRRLNPEYVQRKRQQQVHLGKRNALAYAILKQLGITINAETLEVSYVHGPGNNTRRIVNSQDSTKKHNGIAGFTD
jgi:hypothetical protein